MKLKLNNVEDILQTEITWCLDRPDTNLDHARTNRIYEWIETGADNNS
jgi:uncharacterized protein YijF (DUF1287 family)